MLIVATKDSELIGDWYECHLIVSRMSVDGFTDWRLPTLQELQNIANRKSNDFTLSNYWTADESEESAYQYSFADGTSSKRVKTRVASVRAVRMG